MILALVLTIIKLVHPAPDCAQPSIVHPRHGNAPCWRKRDPRRIDGDRAGSPFVELEGQLIIGIYRDRVRSVLIPARPTRGGDRRGDDRYPVLVELERSVTGVGICREITTEIRNNC